MLGQGVAPRHPAYEAGRLLLHQPSDCQGILLAPKALVITFVWLDFANSVLGHRNPVAYPCYQSDDSMVKPTSPFHREGNRHGYHMLSIIKGERRMRLFYDSTAPPNISSHLFSRYG